MTALRLSSLRRVGRALVAASEQPMVPRGMRFDLGGAEAMVVAQLLERDEASSIAELTRRTGFAQSRVSTAVARLKALRIVRTSADPADARATLVHLPAAVRRGIRRFIERPADAALKELLDGLGTDERTAVVHGLEILAAHIERGERQ